MSSVDVRLVAVDVLGLGEDRSAVSRRFWDDDEFRPAFGVVPKFLDERWERCAVVDFDVGRRSFSHSDPVVADEPKKTLWRRFFTAVSNISSRRQMVFVLRSRRLV